MLSNLLESPLNKINFNFRIFISLYVYQKYFLLSYEIIFTT